MDFSLTTSFASYLNNFNLIAYIVVCVLNGIFLFFASLKFLLSMQQSGYKNKRFLSWLTDKHNSYLSRLMLLCLLGFLFFCLLSMVFSPIVGDFASSLIGFISYFLFTSLYIKAEQSVNKKAPLKKTKRLVRLSIEYILLLSAVTFAFAVFFDLIAYLIKDNVVFLLRYSLICGMPILLPFILVLANGIVYPIEKIIYNYYVKKTKAKLNSFNVTKIAITGSYGKTSVKEILSNLLSVKYRVLSTPKSYNTPMGISLSAKKLDYTHDIFIAEFGARHVGDIKELADIVSPSIGILTGIDNQHLETFKTRENIIKTKNELFLSPSVKTAFFSSDNADSVKLFNGFDGEKYLSGINGKTCFATDIETTFKGTSFTLNFDGEKPIKCFTTLLGKHSVSNIVLASSVCYKLGLTLKEIAYGISKLSCIGHRLELVPNNKDVVIIDDSYNASVDGIKASMEVLDCFSGRKIILTPGLVELGKEENIENYNFGTLLSKHADIVYVIGKHNAEMIIKGLLDSGFDKSKISFFKTLNKANAELNKILVKGDVVLFENDLPDNYS